MRRCLIPPSPPPSRFDADCTEQLITALVHHRKIKGQVRRDRWRVHFRRLRQQDEIPKERIQTVLGWYCGHIGEEFVPLAYSADSFRSKFIRIEQAMKREFGDVTVSPTARKIVERLEQLSWPKGSKSQLPKVVQLSLEGYRSFRKSLRGNNDDSTLSRFILRRLPSSEVFVREWMEDVHRQVAGWADWNGRLNSFVVGPEQSGLHLKCYGLAEEYCGDSDRWNRLFRSIGDRDGLGS